MIRSTAMVILVCTVFFAAGVTGTESGKIELTLEAALERAAADNYRVLASAAGARAQEHGARAERGMQLGELKFNGGVVRNSEASLIRPITPAILSSGVPDMPFDDQYAFWSLAYRVPVLGWGTVSGNRESARLSAQAGQGAAKRATLEVRHRVLTTFIGLLSIEARSQALGAELTALDSLVKHIELGRSAGQYSRVDVLKTQVERQVTLTKIQDLQAAHQGSYADLMALMGNDGTASRDYELVPVQPAPVDTILPPVAVLMNEALSRRSDLKAARNAAAARRASVRAAYGSRLPQVSIGGKLTGVHAGTIDYDDTYWTIDATVSVPLFDMGRRKNLTRKADLSARSSELEAKDLEGRIRAEVTAALAKVNLSRTAIGTQHTTLELATEVNRLERLRYDAGRSDIDNLLRSRADHLLAESALIQARHDFLIALDNLQLTIEGDER